MGWSRAIAANALRLGRSIKVIGLTRKSHTNQAHRGCESAIVVLLETLTHGLAMTSMPTDCNTTRFDFGAVEGRRVEACFDGGTLTSNAGALLLGKVDKALRLTERLSGCFVDHRDPALIEHRVATLVGQRVFGLPTSAAMTR